MKKMMKNIITAMLAFAMLLTPAIVASADDTTASTEERTFITLPEFDFPDDTQINLSNYELPIEEMKALFGEYENALENIDSKGLKQRESIKIAPTCV